MKIELIISAYKTNSYKTNSDSASPKFFVDGHQSLR